MKLFEIVGEYQELYDLIVDGADPEVIDGTLECLNAELEVKAAGYISVLNRLDMEMKRADELAHKYSEIKLSRESAIKRMKEKLLIAMQTLDKTEIPAGDFTIKVKKNGGPLPLKITGDVPDNMTKITVEADKTKIREYLKDHTCDWAHLEERGSHIEIKEA